METCIGVDIGGTKIIVALVSQDGQILERVAFPTPAAPDLLPQVIEAARQFLAQGTQVRGIGVGSAGQINTAQGVVVYASENIPGWTGTPISETLSHALKLPVIADNDVNALAFAESRCGAGQNTTNGLYVAVGTGIGGAIVHQGKLWRGAHWSAGEFGHLTIEWRNGRVCPCGAKGHLEGYAAGIAMAKTYYERANLPTSHNLRPVVERANAGEALACSVLREGAQALGVALNGLVNTFDPDIIVIGGGVAEIGGIWWESLIETLREGNLHAPKQVQVARATLGVDAVVIGAGLLAWEQVTHA